MALIWIEKYKKLLLIYREFELSKFSKNIIRPPSSLSFVEGLRGYFFESYFYISIRPKDPSTQPELKLRRAGWPKIVIRFGTN